MASGRYLAVSTRFSGWGLRASCTTSGAGRNSKVRDGHDHSGGYRGIAVRYAFLVGYLVHLSNGRYCRGRRHVIPCQVTSVTVSTARGRFSEKTRVSLGGRVAAGSPVVCSAAASRSGFRGGRSTLHSSRPRRGRGAAARLGLCVNSTLLAPYDALCGPRKSCPTPIRRS